MQFSVILRRVGMCVLGAALAVPAPGAERAERVASLNLCTDRSALCWQIGILETAQCTPFHRVGHVELPFLPLYPC